MSDAFPTPQEVWESAVASNELHREAVQMKVRHALERISVDRKRVAIDLDENDEKFGAEITAELRDAGWDATLNRNCINAGIPQHVYNPPEERAHEA